MIPFFNVANSNLTQPAQWLVDWFRGGPDSDSGVVVDVHSALGFAPVWYAVNTIAGHVGTLPFNVRRTVEGGSEIAETHPVHRLLRTRPNEWQTATVFREQLMVHSLLLGNGRAAVVKKGGVPVELLPLAPSCTYTVMIEGQKWHVVNCDPDDPLHHRSAPARKGQYIKIPDSEVLHVPGLGYDGFAGKSLITTARDAFGLGIAAQKASSRAFRNGGKPGVVIEAPQGAFRDPKDAKEFIDNFNSYHQGLDNTGRAALMREGMKVQVLGISSSDAEWVAHRKFQRQEVALLFGIQSMPGDEDSVSFNSLEQKNLAYLQNCLMKWLVKWEQECDYKLLGKRAQRSHFTKFDFSELLRADQLTRMETASLAINSRVKNPNEVRAEFDLLPYEGGEEYLNPAIDTNEESNAGNNSGGKNGNEKSDPNDQARRAIHSRLSHLIVVEYKHLARAAKFAPNKNFLEFLEGFYTGKWKETMVSVINELGGGEAIADDYLRLHYDQILDITGIVTPDGLSEAITEVTSNWTADELTEQILGDK